MNCRRWNLLPVLALLSAGCVTAKYRYSVEVPGANAQSPATVQVSWKGGSRTFAVSSDQVAQTKAHQTMQTMFCVFMDVPRGLKVRVTRDGYKPWEHEYAYPDEDFVSPKWDVFERTDVIRLEPANGELDSKRTDGTPVYR